MTPALYRRYIREVLSMTKFGVTDKNLQDAVDDLVSGPIDLSLYRDAIEWNLSKDYIRSGKNEDTEEREWRLTPLGKAKQAEL